MSDPIRSLIRQEIEDGYQEPTPDFSRRALALVDVRRPNRRSTVQMLALTLALLVIAAAVLIARGTHLLSLSQEGSTGPGLRPPLAAYSIVDNQFVSATTGWILIQMHTTSGPDVLMKTSDGGMHWVEQFRYTGKGGIYSIHFAKNGLDGTMSWLEGGAIAVPAGSGPPPVSAPTQIKTYQTHDGGAHWQLAFTTTEDNPPKTQPQPEYAPGFASAAFYLDNDREGWSIRIPMHPAAHNALVMHTTDAGRSWTQIGVLPGTVNCQPYFRDPKNGWCTVSESQTFAYDANGNRLPSPTPPALLYVTHDGGHSWVPASMDLPSGFGNGPNGALALNQPVMIDAAHGLLVVQGLTAPASPLSHSPPPSQPPASTVVLQTRDGGNHWGGSRIMPGGLVVGAGLFLDMNHWLVGNGPFLDETRDGGITWSSRRVLADGFSLEVNQWDYLPPGTIWSQISAGGLVRSTDGGRTWEAVRPPTVH